MAYVEFKNEDVIKACEVGLEAIKMSRETRVNETRAALVTKLTTRWFFKYSIEDAIAKAEEEYPHGTQEGSILHGLQEQSLNRMKRLAKLSTKSTITLTSDDIDYIAAYL